MQGWVGKLADGKPKLDIFTVIQLKMKVTIMFCLLLSTFTGTVKALEQQPSLKDSTVTNKRYINSIQAVGRLSIQGTAVGARYTGALSLKLHPNIGVGPSMFFEQITLKKNIKLPANITEAKMLLYTPGLNLEFGMHSLVAFQTDFSILIGSETITKVNSKNVATKQIETIGGFQMEQNLVLRTSKTNGLKIGVGVFERFVSATVYDLDVGGNLYVGFEF